MQLFSSWKKNIVGIVILIIVFVLLMANPFQSWQFVILLHRNDSSVLEQNVKYILNPKNCSKDVYMLVLVGSHPDHTDVRNVIRHTWGNPSIPNFPFKVVFSFGQVYGLENQQLLKDESAKFGDILQGDFVDSYQNITTRDLMSFRWGVENCRQARFVMHADDDVAFDVYYLIDVLEDRFEQQKDFVACFYITRNAPVERSGRYGMSIEEYPEEVYPDFCHGWMYIMTLSTVHKLLQKSLEIKPFRINDVYITGTLVKALRMKVQDLTMNYTLNYDITLSLVKDVELPLNYKVLPTKANPKVTAVLQYMYLKDALRRHMPRHKAPRKYFSNGSFD